MGYLEYQTWLQRATGAAPMSAAAEAAPAADAGDASLSGLELLRKLCVAARPEPPPRKRVVELSEEEIEIAKTSIDAGRADEVLASRFSVELTRGQLQCLRPRTWLNDEVINFYFKLLQERSKLKETYPNAWFANSFFWNKLSGGPGKHNNEYAYKEVRRWTTKAGVDIFSLDYVIFPMNIGNMHWAMGAIDFKCKGFRYFDSMTSRPHENFVPFLRRYLDDEHKAKKKGAPFADANSWQLIQMNVPQQENSWDCGVFTCCFAEFFSAGKNLSFEQEDMPDMRIRLAARVVRADENWTT